MTSAKTRQYPAVDAMKFVCAFLVIVVHTYPFYEVWPDLGFVTSNILGRIVIPFSLFPPVISCRSAAATKMRITSAATSSG